MGITWGFLWYKFPRLPEDLGQFLRLLAKSVIEVVWDGVSAGFCTNCLAVVEIFPGDSLPEGLIREALSLGLDPHVLHEFFRAISTDR